MTNLYQANDLAAEAVRGFSLPYSYFLRAGRKTIAASWSAAEIDKAAREYMRSHSPVYRSRPLAASPPPNGKPWEAILGDYDLESTSFHGPGHHGPDERGNLIWLGLRSWPNGREIVWCVCANGQVQPERYTDSLAANKACHEILKSHPEAIVGEYPV